MKKFEISAYGVEEMNSQEMTSVDGGRIKGLKKAWKYIQRGMEAIGVYDFLDDIATGWELEKAQE